MFVSRFQSQDFFFFFFFKCTDSPRIEEQFTEFDKYCFELESRTTPFQLSVCASVISALYIECKRPRCRGELCVCVELWLLNKK